ncbi:MAG: helix-turn-helix transcriptional regulator [Terracidiphilus sp.]|jgi:transcriptional regulator with XRE-family HTH domain
MFGDIEYALRSNLRDREYAEEYAASFLNAHVATQIKVIREQRGMTQAGLGSRIGTTQAGISRYEDVNYSSWSLRTLMKLARAFDVRLRVSFEPYGTLPDEVIRFDRARLETVDRESDPGLTENRIKSEVDSDRLVDIGAFKALAGIGQGNQEDIGGRGYGSDSGREGESPRNDGIGRAHERREGSAIGLCSAIG